MENKEAILDKKPIWTFSKFDDEKFYRRKDVLAAMDDFSARLLKENEELEKRYDQLNKGYLLLQSTIDEKDKEVERLKGLIEKAFNKGFNEADPFDIKKHYRPQAINNFKKENNL